MNKNGVFCVYIHKNKANGCVYVGLTSMKPEDRWRNGCSYSHNQKFSNAIKKYGWDGFEHIIVKDGLTSDEASALEVELITKYRATEQGFGYNLTSGGEIGKEYTEESKHKMSENAWDRRGEKNPWYGKHPNDECRRRMSESKKIAYAGSGNPLSKKVICDGIIFGYIGDCAEYYNIPRSTMTSWLNGQRKKPQEWIDKGLDFYTD